MTIHVPSRLRVAVVGGLAVLALASCTPAEQMRAASAKIDATPAMRSVRPRVYYPVSKMPGSGRALGFFAPNPPRIWLSTALFHPTGSRVPILTYAYAHEKGHAWQSTWGKLTYPACRYLTGRVCYHPTGDTSITADQMLQRAVASSPQARAGTSKSELAADCIARVVTGRDGPPMGLGYWNCTASAQRVARLVLSSYYPHWG